jgi:hypothetical protein
MTKHKDSSQRADLMVRSRAFAAFLLALAANCFAQERNHPTTQKLGTVNISTSCRQVAQKEAAVQPLDAIHSIVWSVWSLLHDVNA